MASNFIKQGMICAMEEGSAGWSKFAASARQIMVKNQFGTEAVEMVHAERHGLNAMEISKLLAAHSQKVQGACRLTAAGRRMRTIGLVPSKTG
jgi:hypothetical protein